MMNTYRTKILELYRKKCQFGNRSAGKIAEIFINIPFSSSNMCIIKYIIQFIQLSSDEQQVEDIQWLHLYFNRLHIKIVYL